MNSPPEITIDEVLDRYEAIFLDAYGVLIHDGVALDRATDSALTETKPFSKAPIKFQGTKGEVAFTNVFIRPLPDSR